MHYCKPHTSAYEQVIHLRTRGLYVQNAASAAQKIEQIGYERLRIYFLSRRHLNVSGKPFRLGTTFDDIAEIYECDLELRQHCFGSVGRFEILLRNQISEALSARHGSHPHDDAKAFASTDARNKSYEAVLKMFNQSSDPRAQHYRCCYTSPTIPPIWVLKEFLTFGQAYHLFKVLSPTLQQDIAHRFSVWSCDVFTSWIGSFLDLRNICAHHDRLFNRHFQKQPKRFRSLGTPQAKPYSLKGVAECLDHCLQARGQAATLVADLQSVLNCCAKIHPSEAGF